MKIKISTKVEQNIEQVWNQFDVNLLKKLSPPFPPVKVLHYIGHQIGEKVSFELNFFIFKQKWESEITDNRIDENERYFIDEGRILPFFLKYWKHKHRIVKSNSGSKIIDEIEFKTPSILTDYIFYPLLYLQFLYRKPIYQKLFRV
ncbi:MAG: hypothetical protein MUF45_06685 [Spirosomaceae bacterium]|jgi:ligand-binding SRPBCC domain-containing protein|nr:hypothetical protein [Spirosomataceae bacterium]